MSYPRKKGVLYPHESQQYLQLPAGLYFTSQRNQMNPPHHDLDPPQYSLRDLRRCGFATKVRRQHRSLAQHGIYSDLDSSCGLAVAQMAEHHCSRADGSDGVGLVLACYVWGGAVHAGATKYKIISIGSAAGLVGGTGVGVATYGSPITNLSPAFTEGTTPREPTRAAAASLASVKSG